MRALGVLKGFVIFVCVALRVLYGSVVTLYSTARLGEQVVLPCVVRVVGSVVLHCVQLRGCANRL